MASNKNNIKELVTDDDDPTEELEALAVDADELLEADANTFNFGDGGENSAISELRSDLKDRSETISRLQFDIEQLRARWLGLEAEIKSREEITKNLQAELEEHKSSLERKQDLIKERDALVKSLKAEIKEREERHQELGNQRDALERTVEEKTHQLAGLQADLAELDTKNEDLLDQNALLQSELDTFSKEEIAATESKLKVQAAQLASDIDAIRDLERRLENSEKYADSIRQQLSDLLLSNRNVEETRWQLQAQVDESEERIEGLTRLLEESSGNIAELTEQLSLREQSHAEEIRLLRFELGEAQDTVTDSESLNERLANELRESRGRKEELERTLSEQDKQSKQHLEELEKEVERLTRTSKESETLNEKISTDLFESRAHKDELERMLSEHDEQSGQLIEELEKDIKRLTDENAELERKLEAKSEAVDCLLDEVARKSEQIDSIGEIEQAIHDLDDRMSESIDVEPSLPRDRVTRLLVGKVGDQVLRFPLFKDRLTIGRTSANDIQLKAQYISRRHAVILTEGDATRIIDWGSKNGVFVNSNRVTEHFLKNGDVVTIGTADFRYEERVKRD